jgi:hypothetical protein
VSTEIVRFMIVSDDDGHDYVIPAEKRAEWREYIEAAYGDDPPDEPEWVRAIGGSLSLLTFTDPVIR